MATSIREINNLEDDIEVISGLKTGAHVALLLQGAWDRIREIQRLQTGRARAPHHGPAPMTPAVDSSIRRARSTDMP